MAQDRPVTLAAIIGAHGVTGEVRLKLFTDDLAGLKRYRQFNDGRLTLASIRPNKAEAIARFAEVTDRNAAEALRGAELTVPRSALPPLGEGEYYHSDLIGLAALSTGGTPLGEVIAVHNYGAGDIVEIVRADGGKFMVPVAAIPDWTDHLLIDPDYAA